MSTTCTNLHQPSTCCAPTQSTLPATMSNPPAEKKRKADDISDITSWRAKSMETFGLQPVPAPMTGKILSPSNPKRHGRDIMNADQRKNKMTKKR